MICMIPKLNLEVREMRFMFCDLHVSKMFSKITLRLGYKFNEFALFYFGFALDLEHFLFRS